MWRKKTKIVATIGPATADANKMAELVRAGANVFRFNFSHGDYEGFKKLKASRDEAERISGLDIAMLQDLCGPKIRIGEFSTETVELKEKATFTLDTEKMVGDENGAYINYEKLPAEVKIGGRILLDDGKVELKVTDIKGKIVETKVVRGGVIKGRRGVNLPGAYLSTSALTDKDKADALFGIELGVHFVALSFVRTAQDVEDLRVILKENKSDALIIAKIETEEAIENLDEIIDSADGVMVARGDLAVELAAERVPIIQKTIIKKCRELGKPVITATQMLESMIVAGVPTRAEVSDVANAILDGTDAVMLSAETATGAYPIEAVKIMTKVAHEVEKHYPVVTITNLHKKGKTDVVDSIASSVVNIAHDIGAKLIVALSETGFTGKMVSRHRPDVSVMALTPNRMSYYHLMLSYGVLPVFVDQTNSLDQVFDEVREYALKNEIATQGDRVVVSAGAPFHAGAKTNMLFVEII